jgi:hypothetical protein
VSFTLQVKDPEDMVVTVNIPGKYNPDILDDAVRRVVELYKEVLETRFAAVMVQLSDAEEDDDEKEEEDVA